MLKVYKKILKPNSSPLIGILSWDYIGVDIWRDGKKRVLTISQEGYLNKIVDVFGMEQAKVESTPIGAYFLLVAIKELEVVNEVTYMKIVP